MRLILFTFILIVACSCCEVQEQSNCSIVEVLLTDIIYEIETNNKYVLESSPRRIKDSLGNYIVTKKVIDNIVLGEKLHPLNVSYIENYLLPDFKFATNDSLFFKENSFCDLEKATAFFNDSFQIKNLDESLHMIYNIPEEYRDQDILTNSITISMSEIIINNDKNKFICAIGYSYGPKNGQGNLIMGKLVNGRWLFENIVLTVS